MTAIEYNKIDNTYFLIEEKTKENCLNNNIDYYDYLSVFKRLLSSYIKNKEKISIVLHLNFNDKISTRAVLNKRFFLSKEKEMELANNNFKKSKKELFTWLDNVKEPYFFLLNPIYNYNTGLDYNSYFSKIYGYKKEKFTGSNNLNICIEYYNYKNE